MSIEQGDIVLVPFPFTDFHNFKHRPVLVVSGPTFNSKTRDLIVCAITTNPVHKDFGVQIIQEDLIEGNLLKDSIVKTSHVATISKSIVGTKIGTLGKNKFEEIREQLCDVFKD